MQLPKPRSCANGTEPDSAALRNITQATDPF